MRSYTVDTSPVQISVNGITFTLQKSDGEAYRLARTYMEYIRTLDPNEKCALEDMIASGCDLADSLLGNGACFRIFGSTPISLGHVVSLCAQIAGGCLQAYRQYLKEEYLEADA